MQPPAPDEENNGPSLPSPAPGKAGFWEGFPHLWQQLPPIPDPTPFLQQNMPTRLPTWNEIRPQSVKQLYDQAGMLTTAAGFFPQTAPIGAYGGPLLSTAYAGFNVYKTGRDEYSKNKDLPPDLRFQQTLKKTGEVALFNLLATILIPVAIGGAIFNRLKHRFEAGRIPRLFKFLQARPMLYAGLIVTGVMMALGGVINKGTKLLLDWTYRPLVRNKKPEGWDRLREYLQQGLERLEDWEARFVEWVEEKTGVRLKPAPDPRMPARADWPQEMPPLKHPTRFETMFA